ncbi:YceI family protein [Flavobacterium fluviatile]|uniref:YceI family protein n=1 Tax=Flavobacterium fluviatile TaxID=1862387 RepID=UPI0013D7EA8C|nr:YceI family protein [Flavobacterium fluviatile]
MKRTVFLILLFTACSIIAQEKITTEKAIINFEASVPCFEEIKAINKSVMISLDPKTSTLLCTVLLKDFHFKLDLMEEHFNENYVQSHRYPKAVFKGKIAKFDLKDIDETEKEYLIKGKLLIRGKSKDILVKALFKKVYGGIQIKSDFPITISDFDIEIPERIASKIAKTAKTELSGIIGNDEEVLLSLK